MRRSVWRVCVLWAACLWTLTGYAQVPITQWRHASGAGVWLMATQALPMVDVQIEFDGGSRRDGNLPGLADLAAQTLPLATRALPGPHDTLPALNEQQLSERWADLGAEFSLSVTPDALVLRLRSLSEASVLQAAARLAGQILAAPAYPTEGWQRVQTQAIAAWREAQTQPQTQLDQAFAQAVLGSHPYGRRSTDSSLARLRLNDIADYAGRVLHSCTARVAIVGAVHQAQAQKLVQNMLGPLAARPCVSQPAQATDLLVRPAKSEPAAAPIRVPLASQQTHIALGQVAVARKDPDYLALLVGNYILGGGGFSARLMQAVREQRGLAYSVDSGFDAWQWGGQFRIDLQTKNDQADAAVQVVRKTLSDYVATGPSAAELRAAKAHLVGGFALNLDSNRKLLAALASIARNGFARDYLVQWPKRVARLSRTEVRRALQKVLRPQQQTVVLVGQQSVGDQP